LRSSGKGRLYIVGTGPGAMEYMTGRAAEAIRASEYIIGNAFYLRLIEQLVEGKEVIYSSMGKEVERARMCIDLAKDHTVSMVSGGDPGVYGMASIVLEVLEHDGSDIEFEVIPGVTAATAAASIAGSPLSGDYITISLSNLLTPLEEIRRRLDLALAMKIPIVIYNPKSRGRPDNLSMAMKMALEHRSPDSPVAVVRNAYREGQSVTYTDIGSLVKDDQIVDMHSIVILGGEDAHMFEINGEVKGIITPRGYDRKYVY